MNAKLKLRQYVKMAAQNIVLPIFYAVCSIRPLDRKLIIFADAHHHSCPDNLKPVLRALRKQQESSADIRIREMYLDYQDASFGRVLRHMLFFMASYAHAGTVVICDNFLPAAGWNRQYQPSFTQGGRCVFLHPSLCLGTFEYRLYGMSYCALRLLQVVAYASQLRRSIVFQTAVAVQHPSYQLHYLADGL